MKTFADRGCYSDTKIHNTSELPYIALNDMTLHSAGNLASFPGLPRYVRILICGGGNNAVRTGFYGVIPSPANQNAHVHGRPGNEATGNYILSFKG